MRHPPPRVAAGICYGSSDLPLAEAPAEALARLVPLLPPQVTVFSSPLQRCRLLAEALHPAPQLDERLRETDFGSWEMQPWADLPRAELDAWAADPLHFRGHGGESVAQVQLRVLAFLEKLPSAPSVIVTHGGVMKVLAALLLNLPQHEWLGMQFDYASVTRIDVDAGSRRLLWHNSIHA